MVTICVLFGIIGHLFGAANSQPPDVRAVLYPSPRQRLLTSKRSIGVVPKQSATPKHGAN